jgi:hypothetical protein
MTELLDGWTNTAGGVKRWRGGEPFPEPSDRDLVPYLTDAAGAALSFLYGELERLRYVDDLGYIHGTVAGARRHWLAGEKCETCSEGRRLTRRISHIERVGSLG